MTMLNCKNARAHLYPRCISMYLEAAVGRVEDDKEENARLHVEVQRLTRILLVNGLDHLCEPLE